MERIWGASTLFICSYLAEAVAQTAGRFGESRSKKRAITIGT